jgi:hypothetical protein
VALSKQDLRAIEERWNQEDLIERYHHPTLLLAQAREDVLALLKEVSRLQAEK